MTASAGLVASSTPTPTPSLPLPPEPTSSTNVITPTQCPTTITATQCINGINFLLGVGNVAAVCAPARFQKQNLFFPRLDWHINTRNDVFVDYNFANFDSTYGYSPANTFSNSSPSTNGPTSYHERFLVAGLTTQIRQVLRQPGPLPVRSRPRDRRSQRRRSQRRYGVVTFGMPNALPRVAEPDEHRIQFTDVFSTTKGRHTLKFGGDVNLVHEIMINLFQGGGIYSYGESTPLANFQDWIADAFAGQPGDTDPYAGYHYNTFVQTIDVVNTAAGHTRQGRLLDEDVRRLRRRLLEAQAQLPPHRRCPLRHTAHASSGARSTTTILRSPPSTARPSRTSPTAFSPVSASSWTPYPGTVVRGGYGLFSALNQGSTYYAMRVENGVVQINYNYNGCAQLRGHSHQHLPHRAHLGGQPQVSQCALPAHRSAAHRQPSFQSAATLPRSTAPPSSVRRASTASTPTSFHRSRTK